MLSVPSLAVVHSLRVPGADIHQIAFSPDGRFIAAACSVLRGSRSIYSRVIVWQVQSLRLVHSWKAAEDGVWGLSFSSDSKQIAASGGRSVEVWDVMSGIRRVQFKGENGDDFYDVEFLKRDSILAVGSEDFSGGGHLKLLNFRSGKIAKILADQTSQWASFALSPDGRHVLCGGVNGYKIWDVEAGKVLYASGKQKGEVWAGGYLRGDKYVATLAAKPDPAEKTTLQLWDIRTKKQVASLTIPPDAMAGISVSPNGKQIAYGYGNTVKLWTPNLVW